MIKMEEQEEPTPQEVTADQIRSVPLDRRNFTLSDTFTSVLKVGDISITSPIMSVKDMVSTTKELLKDKQVRNYLESVKENKIKSGQRYFG